MRKDRYIQIISDICKNLIENSLLGNNHQQEEAQVLLKQRSEEIIDKLTELSFAHNYPIATFAVAILYVAVREQGLPLTMSDLISSLHDRRIKMRDVGRAYRKIVKRLALDTTTNLPPIDYARLVDTLAKKLEQQYFVDEFRMDWEAAKNDAKALIERARTKEGKLFAGKDPRCIAAAAFYKSLLDHNIHLSQENIAHHASISSVALRQSYHAFFFPTTTTTTSSSNMPKKEDRRKQQQQQINQSTVRSLT
ncbi:MAG: hypothetical protein QXM92_02420 [Candidatus Anstonellales archaeon]